MTLPKTPWTVSDDNKEFWWEDFYVLDADGRLVAIVVHAGVDGPDTQEVANLLAKAPEMKRRLDSLPTGEEQ